MHKFKFIIAFLLIAGCTPLISIDERGITPLWSTKKTTPVVVEPKKVTAHEFRCLVIEDVGKREILPKTQLAMLTAKNFRDFLKANCVKDSKGDPQFRFVNKDTELTGVWSEMKSRSQISGYPQVIFQNGSAYIAERLPETWEALKKDAEAIAGVTP